MGGWLGFGESVALPDPCPGFEGQRPESAEPGRALEKYMMKGSHLLEPSRGSISYPLHGNPQAQDPTDSFHIS